MNARSLWKMSSATVVPITDPRPIQMYLGTSVLLYSIQATLRDTVAETNYCTSGNDIADKRTDLYRAEEPEHHTDTVGARLVSEDAIQPIAYMRFSTRDSHCWSLARNSLCPQRICKKHDSVFSLVIVLLDDERCPRILLPSAGDILRLMVFGQSH